MSARLLEGKVIFLTGGSTGIGWDCAQAYAAEGACVVMVARRKDPVEQAAAKLGSDHLGLACDVSSGDEVKGAIEKTLARYGKLDAVHNNAGIATPSKPVHETTGLSGTHFSASTSRASSTPRVLLSKRSRPAKVAFSTPAVWLA